MNPKISILIPCYNTAKWIKQSIQSALDQTYPNKEVIVVDDGSTDGSLDIIQSFADQIKWEAGPNRGGNAARNRLLELSSGEWLQYLDSDDYLLPTKIAGQITALVARPEADVIYSPVKLVEDYGEKKQYVMSLADPNDFIVNFIDWGALQTGGMLWKKSVLVEAGGWKTDQKVCQEHELLLRLIIMGKAFVRHNEAGAVYRYTEQASVSRRDKRITVRERMRITDELEVFLNQRKTVNPDRRRALCQARFESARNIYEKDALLAKQIIGKLKDTDRTFVPDGKAAPALYRWAYQTIGFEGAEALAGIRRSLGLTCRRG